MPQNATSYEADGHMIFHGNAFSILSGCSLSTVDFVFADPPYNIGKKFGDFHDRWVSDKLFL